MKKYYSIGETAKINNVSVQALRLYDRMDLLKPARVDEETGYRYYTVGQFIYIDMIKYSKYIGAPLKELKEVLHSRDVSDMLSFIKKQRGAIKDEIRRLKRISKNISSMEEKIEYAIKLEGEVGVYERHIGERQIIDTGLENGFSEEEVEMKIRGLDKVMYENDMDFEGETGYFISVEDLMESCVISYQNIYTSVSSKIKDTKTISQGDYLCISYRKADRKEAVERIRNHIENENMEIQGTAVEIQLLNTLEQYQNDEILYELQILLKKR